MRNRRTFTKSRRLSEHCETLSSLTVYEDPGTRQEVELRDSVHKVASFHSVFGFAIVD